MPPTSIPEYDMEPGCSPAHLGNHPTELTSAKDRRPTLISLDNWPTSPV